MPAVSRDGRYHRPLLHLPRADTVAACAAQGLTPWRDPSNHDPAYGRARVRAVLEQMESSLGPGIAAALARTAAMAAEDAEVHDALAADLLGSAGNADEHADGYDIAVLAAAPTAIRRRALLAAARAAGAPGASTGFRHVIAMDALVTAWHGQGAARLPGGLAVHRDCGRLLFSRPARPPRTTTDQPQE